MYNRYIRNDQGTYTRIPEEDAPPVRTPPEPERPDEAEKVAEHKAAGGLSGLLKGLKLEELDTGDILLLLILRFLLLEGDDLELIITLGLLLLLGLE